MSLILHFKKIIYSFLADCPFVLLLNAVFQEKYRLIGGKTDWQNGTQKKPRCGKTDPVRDTAIAGVKT